MPGSSASRRRLEDFQEPEERADLSAGELPRGDVEGTKGIEAGVGNQSRSETRLTGAKHRQISTHGGGRGSRIPKDHKPQRGGRPSFGGC